MPVAVPVGSRADAARRPAPVFSATVSMDAITFLLYAASFLVASEMVSVKGLENLSG